MQTRNSFGVILLLVWVCSCTKPGIYAPVSLPNPWQDNYLSVSGMENYRSWGTYNVHDPACKKFGDTYYMYSTDAIFAENKEVAKQKNVPLGYIQVRKSKDLVNWDLVGWAFPEIPAEAVNWVRTHAEGQGATNIWAPYIIKHNDVYRLYYCVSAFGKKTSYIGLAESASPEGPWIQKGCVVKTDEQTPMNAIDPSVIEDPQTGRWWMHYGSYFGGLFCVELNPATGLTRQKNDYGHLIARRANYKKDNLEAPEIIYNPELKKYFLFVSYDPLMTTYNVRVGRANKPEGPFLDYAGHDLKDTTNNFPILTAPYAFEGHPGWAGTAHCGVWREENGRYYMFHQGRLSPENQLMVLHTREIFFNAEGWPVVSPERYAGTKSRRFTVKDMLGEWEIMRVIEPLHERQLEAGQVLWGEGQLVDDEINRSSVYHFEKNKTLREGGRWSFYADKQLLDLTIKGESIRNLIIFAGHDWERQTETILFTGLDQRGRSVWGKRIR